MLLNGVFAMTELAMMTSRHSRLRAAADRGSRGAAEALKLAAEPTRLLSTVQVGITLIGILAGAYGEKSLASGLRQLLARAPVLAPYAEVASLVIVVLGITYLSLVVGELVPKRLALAYPEAVATLISRPLAALSWVMAAPVKVLTVSTDFVARLLQVRAPAGHDVSVDDVRAMAARATEVGTFDAAHSDILQGALGLGDLTARDLMVPRPGVVCIDVGTRGTDLRTLIGTSPYSHFPVCRGGLDSLVGVVHIKSLIAHGLIAGDDFDVASVAQPALYVPETMSAGRLLETLRGGRTHMAIVTDEHGTAAGVVTLNDITSAVLGNMPRHGETVEEDVIERNDGSLLISGRFPAARLPARLGLPDSALDASGGVSTVAGVVMTSLGRLPRTGEQTEWHGWRLEVVDMDGNRVDRVLASRAPTE